MGYKLICGTDGERMSVSLKFDRPLDPGKIRQASFRMLLYPPAYFMKSFQGDAMAGVFPRQYSGHRTLLAASRVLRLAQEDPPHSLTFERRDGTLELGDERGSHPTGWFSVTAAMEPGDTGMELEIRPSIDPQWRRQPVIGISQVGYHPGQPKRAVLELDSHDDAGGNLNLYQLTLSGEERLVKSGAPKPWGPFLNYRYAIFDFSDVTGTGAYVIEYRGQRAGPFRIDPQVYAEAWQPTLEVFLPVQMCHVAVRERNRFWHGACHLDDAEQAPANHPHIDCLSAGRA